MATYQYSELYEHFDKLYDLEPKAQEKYLSELYQTEPELADKLGSMLVSAADIDTFFEKVRVKETQEPNASEGESFSHWEVKRMLGTGGMGAVYLVQRNDGVHEGMGALKIIKQQSPEHLQMLRQETQALAKLEHNNIARLIDAGHSQKAFFMVTEFVDGLPIDQYCKENSISLETLIALFIQLADAVGYIHSHLMLHADVKPSNILVNAKGQVKLIDFGLSRLQKNTEKNSVAYSLGFSPPEQISGEGLAVTSDLYSLGATLYYLVTGNKIDPNSNSLWETINLSGVKISADLKSVIQKCIQISQADRYQSVSELSDDLQAILTRRPVSTKRDKVAYVAGKFLQRHPTFAVLSLFLLMTTGYGLYQGYVAGIERDLAIREEQRLRAVQDYVYQVFAEAGSMGETTTAKQALASVAARFDKNKNNSAKSFVTIHALAELYFRIDDYESALPLYESYISEALNIEGEEARVAMAYHDMASILQRKNKLEDAQEKFEKAMSFWSQRPNYYAEEILEARDLEARLKRDLGNIEESIKIFNAAISERLKRYSDATMDLGFLYNNFGTTLFRSGRLEEAKTAFINAKNVWSALGRQTSNDALNSANNLASISAITNDLETAEINFREALKTRLALYGDSAATAALLNNLGKVLLQRGKVEEAAHLLSQAVKMATQFAGETSPHAFSASFGLVQAKVKMNQIDQAFELASQVLDKSIEVFGDKGIYTAMAKIEMARTLIAKNLPGATAILLEAKEVLEPLGARAARPMALIAELEKGI